MCIPVKVHFGLGFGFKYQYLLSVLIHGLMNMNKEKPLIDRRQLHACKNYMIRNLNNNTNIHANANIFMQRIQVDFSNISIFNYNRDALLLLEGEDGFFEDINIFSSYNDYSKIDFIQVKGCEGTSCSGNLNKAVIKTFKNMLKNENIQVPFSLTILINEQLTNWYYLRHYKDKIKMIILVFKDILEVNQYSITPAIKNKLLIVLEDYLNDMYLFGPSTNILNFFQQNTTIRQYTIIHTLLSQDNNGLIKKLLKMKKIVDNTRIIDKLDYRLIYLFLKFYYGNDKLKKILWNIEMKSMSAEVLDLISVRSQLRNINFSSMYISQINFSSNHQLKKGKIL